MNLYRGEFFVKIVTAVETDYEEVMTEKAHEGFQTDLFNEIQTLLEAKGYICSEIGVTLKDAGEADVAHLKYIESCKKSAIDKREMIYNKLNTITRYRIHLD